MAGEIQTQYKDKPCGKICFPDKASAKKEKKKINHSRKTKVKPKILHVYYCEPCTAWHLTSMHRWRHEEMVERLGKRGNGEGLQGISPV